VTAPRFVPRSYALSAKDFGTTSQIRWRSAEGLSAGDYVNLRVAQVHHALSLRVRNAVAVNGTTIMELADGMGMNHLRLGRLLRGEIVLRFEDVVLIDDELGTTMLQEIADVLAGSMNQRRTANDTVR